MQLQGLPEMPIRAIRLRNVSITARRGLICEDARDITLDHVQILSAEGPPRAFIRSRDVVSLGPADPSLRDLPDPAPRRPSVPQP